jgi:hypothetical protein
MNPAKPRYAILAATMALQFASCTTKSDDGESTTTGPVSPLRAMMSAVATLGADLYNTNYAGKPCTTVAKTTTCPGGGDVVISGSFTCSTGSNGVQTTNIDFLYDVTDCIEVRSGLTLTMTGKISHTGSSTNVSSIITAETIQLKSQGEVKMKAVGANYEKFSDNCTFAVKSSKANATSDSVVSGVICGESFSIAPFQAGQGS